MSGRAVMVEKLLIGLRKLQDAHAYCDVDNSVKKMIEELPTFLPLAPLSKELVERVKVQLEPSLEGSDSVDVENFNGGVDALAAVAGVGPICNLNDCKYFRQHAAAGRTNV